MNTLKVAVDNGNFNTKSSEGMLYTSGFNQSDKEFITPEMQLFFGGKYYSIGGKRMSLQQEKAMENDTFVLTLPAIANAMKLNSMSEANIVLGVGLPIDIYAEQRADFAKYFMRGSLNINFEGKDYSFNIADCKVFAQGHAALCAHYSQLKDYENIVMVDIGGYTVDVLSLSKFKVIKSGSLRKGTIVMFNDIKSKLQSQNIMLSDDQLTDAMFGRIEHLRKEFILQTLTNEITIYTKELLHALLEFGLDFGMPIAFSGGGAELLGHRLYTSKINTVAVFDRFANAKGYKFLLERQ